MILMYQVDSFTDRLFAGNPAAVCLLGDRWPPDTTLCAIAAENNLSETAYLRPQDDHWLLRWFTPTVEVELCGHGTLAAAHVLFTEVTPEASAARFETASGRLTVTRSGPGRYRMDFPALPPRPCEVPPVIPEALGIAVRECHQRPGGNYLVPLPDADAVRAVRPDFRALATLGTLGVAVTAPGDAPGIDFVSRYFVPGAGVDEDPVTGSLHCELTPLWAGRLGRTTLRARQLSARGGTIDCTLEGDRVALEGHAVTYLRGRLADLAEEVTPEGRSDEGLHGGAG